MLELIGQKDGHDVYFCSHIIKHCVSMDESDIVHWTMTYISAGERHTIQEAYCCRGCTDDKPSLHYLGEEYSWGHGCAKPATKPKVFEYHNKPEKKRRYTHEILTKGAIELYGKGSEVYVSDFHLPRSDGHVYVKCGKHREIFSASVQYTANASSLSCPSCLRESGYTRKTPQGYQKHIDSIFGEGQYLLQFAESPHRKNEIDVFHKGCGMVYPTTLELLHQGKNCGYCANGKVYYQHHLDDKIKKSGAPITVQVEDYLNRDSENKFKAICNQCSTEIKINTGQLSKGKIQCPHCEQQKKLAGIPDGWIWCVGTYTYKCMEHNHFHEGVFSTLKCKYCSGSSVDTDTMRYILIKKFGDRYDYSQAEYLGKECKIDVRCKKHDHVFTAEYHGHSKGKSNCPICNDEERGWGRDGFYSTDKPSNIYLVQLGDEHVKVGLSNKPNARWKRIKYESGLKITPLKIWKGRACELFYIEHECHYSSGIERDNSLGTHFNGWKEVYHISQKDRLLKFLEERLE